MTAIRASQSASSTGRGTDDFSDRSAFGPYGIPLWGAILAAAVPTAIGSIADILIWGQPGTLFKILFFLGSLAAVLTVKRARVFGPMVQPPLILGVVVPILVLITGAGSSGGGGLAGQALAIARPLITSFPIMAAASAVTLGIGLIRIFVTQKAPVTALDPEAIDPEAKTRKQRPVSPKTAKKPPERGAARKSATKGPKDSKASAGPKERKSAGPKERKSAAKERAPENRKNAPEGRRPQPRGDNPRGSGPRGGAQPRGEGRPKPANPPAGRSNSGGAPKPAGQPRPADQRGAPPPRRGPAPPRQNPGRPRPPEPPPSNPRRPR